MNGWPYESVEHQALVQHIRISQEDDGTAGQLSFTHFMGSAFSGLTGSIFTSGRLTSVPTISTGAVEGCLRVTVLPSFSSIADGAASS